MERDSKLKYISRDEIQLNGLPKDFWNYHVNPITGFVTYKENDLRNKEDKEILKYSDKFGTSGARLNGNRI